MSAFDRQVNPDGQTLADLLVENLEGIRRALERIADAVTHVQAVTGPPLVPPPPDLSLLDTNGAGGGFRTWVRRDRKPGADDE